MNIKEGGRKCNNEERTQSELSQEALPWVASLVVRAAIDADGRVPNQQSIRIKENIMKRSSNLVVLLLSSILAAGFPMEADAEPVSIAITAEVAEVDDTRGYLGGAINVGDVITGMYVYESTTPDTQSLPTVGDYRQTTAPFGITLNAGGFVFRTDPNNVNFLVEIVNDHGFPARDNYLLRSYNNIFDRSVPFERENHIAWQLDDPTRTALSSDALPTGPPVLANWQSLFGLTIESGGVSGGGDKFLIRAHVTSAKRICSKGPDKKNCR
jgi:hypothetical protein